MEDEEKLGHDWNEGRPDHEGVMAVAQLQQITKMASEMSSMIGENDELEGWVQYKLSRAYDDLNAAYTYINYRKPVSLEKNNMPQIEEAIFRKLLKRASKNKK